jgi:predicted protein tyrosine phosphatase
VCTANAVRSRTAETLYRDDRRFRVKSAGTSAFANHQVEEDDVAWADYIVVMEEEHKRWLESHIPDELLDTPILVLGIPDIFQYMDRALVRDLRERFEEAYRPHAV